MKTAGRENPNHGATLPHNRAHGAVSQNRFRSIRGAAKQEKFQPKEVCFFLTSPFIERSLKELVRSYLTITKDLGRVMSRVKAIYRSWGIPCTGKQVYAPRYRSEWLGKLREAGVQRRAEFYYQQFDALRSLRQDVRRALLAEAQKHDAWKLLRTIPFIGPIRAALLIALIQTPHRFRTKRQLWTFSGFGIETYSSAEHRYVQGELQRAKKPASVRGLNRNHNHDLKNL